MAITRSFSNAFQITDWTNELLIIPNKVGLISESGLFMEDGVSQHTITFEEITEPDGVMVDRVRGERNTVNKNHSRKLRTFSIPHFPLDDYISPSDIQGQRAYGSPDQPEQLSLVRTRKMERIVKLHGRTLEVARAKLLTDGTFYAPNGTIDNTTTLWAEFGVTRKQIDFVLGTGSTNVIAKIEEGIAHIQDNANGESMTGFTAYCSPTFFNKLIAHQTVTNAFQYYSSTQEPLRQRLGGNTTYYRQFVWAGVTFIEVRDSVNGTPLIPSGDAVLVPNGTEAFETVFGPAERFSTVNTIGVKNYLFEEQQGDVKYLLQSEMNVLNFCKKPAMIVRLHSSN